jgi:hypothetical protein
MHRWRFPHHDDYLAPAVCDRCHREGRQYYDGLSGGVSLLRGSQPRTDLRMVYR